MCQVSCLSEEKIDEEKKYILDEIKHDLMSEKYRETCKYLSYVKHILILVSVATGFGLISVIDSLVCVSVGVTSFAVGSWNTQYKYN